MEIARHILNRYSKKIPVTDSIEGLTCTRMRIIIIPKTVSKQKVVIIEKASYNVQNRLLNYSF